MPFKADEHGGGELKLDHLLRLTDCTGIIQHAVYALPDRGTGYTTDDNARALIAALKLVRENDSHAAGSLAERYLGFLRLAQLPDGRFRNFMSYDRRFVDAVGSEDSFGRAVWACGYAARARPGWNAVGPVAREIVERALPWVPRLRAPRARAFATLGLFHYLQVAGGPGPQAAAFCECADALAAAFRGASGPGWYWFEPYLTYSNAVLPLALLMAYELTGAREHLDAAVAALDFLTSVLWKGNHLKLVGNRGWLHRGGGPAEFDEQPVDAGAMVLAHLTAHRITGRDEYQEHASGAFEWFLGRNALAVPLYDPDTGGCFDGLTPAGVNRNQGAESLLSFLLARLALIESARGKKQAVA